jgi:hypothetical protein
LIGEWNAMNVLKCDICGKIFEYGKSFIDCGYTINGRQIEERLFNKVKLYHVPRPPKDQYDDSDLMTLYSYDVCPSCARRLAEFIGKEKADHENL